MTNDAPINHPIDEDPFYEEYLNKMQKIGDSVKPILALQKDGTGVKGKDLTTIALKVVEAQRELIEFSATHRDRLLEVLKNTEQDLILLASEVAGHG